MQSGDQHTTGIRHTLARFPAKSQNGADHTATLMYHIHFQQEAQLPQRDRTTLHVSKFMLCFTRYGSYKGINQQIK